MTAYNFNLATSRAKAKPVVNKLSKIEKEAEKLFSVKLTEKCTAGEKYYLGGEGVFVCTNVGQMEFAGVSAGNVFTLEKVFSSTRTVIRLTEQKIKSTPIRSLASVSDIDNVLKIIESKKMTICLSKVNSMNKMAVICEALKSANPVVLAELACMIFGKSKVVKDNLSYVSEGNRALELLAGETAIVKNISYEDALKKLSELSGKPPLNDLRRYGFVIAAPTAK